MTPQGASAASSITRILIFEDNEADVFLVETALQQTGMRCELEVCSSGGEALERIRQFETNSAPAPHLLLMDLNLPQYGGEELLRHFRQCANCAGTPVIVMSSSESPAERSRVEAAGATFFAKPNDLRQYMRLGELIRSALHWQNPVTGR